MRYFLPLLLLLAGCAEGQKPNPLPSASAGRPAAKDAPAARPDEAKPIQ